MNGIIRAAEQTGNPIVVILAIILVSLASAFGTFLITFWKMNTKDINRLHNSIKEKDEQIIEINKEKDEIIEGRNKQLTDISEKAFTVISNNNISSIRCRDAIKTVTEKINTL